MRGLLIVLVLVAPFALVAEGRAEAAVRWEGNTVTYYFNPGGYEGDLTVAQLEAAVIAGLEEWNSWASVRHVYGGLTLLAADEANTISVIAFGPNDVGGIAAARARQQGGWITEVDITLRADITDTMSASSIASVIAHEAGHGLGLSHTTTHPCTREDRAIMCGGHVYGWQLRIHTDDIRHLRALYPPSFAR